MQNNADWGRRGQRTTLIGGEEDKGQQWLGERRTKGNADWGRGGQRTTLIGGEEETDNADWGRGGQRTTLIGGEEDKRQRWLGERGTKVQFSKVPCGRGNKLCVYSWGWCGYKPLEDTHFNCQAPHQALVNNRLTVEWFLRQEHNRWLGWKWITQSIRIFDGR